MDPRAAVPLLALLEGRPHQDFQSAIIARMCRFPTSLGHVEPTARHTQAATQERDRVLCLLHGDEPKPYRLCFAKKAAAFFRMSRSSWRIRFSLRSRASSSRSAVVKPVLPSLRSASACCTHSRTAEGTKSSSRATALTDFPSSNTNRTVWALNSSLKRRRARLARVVSAIVDIVSAFRNVSTKPDQAQLPDNPLRDSPRSRRGSVIASHLLNLPATVCSPQ